MVDLQNLILIEMNARGIKKFKAQPIFIDVTEPDMIISLGKYIYLFASTDIDVRQFTKCELISADNYFAMCKGTLKRSDSSQFLFFTEEMEIITSNYGADKSDFIPYRLEFWKIIPEKE